MISINDLCRKYAINIYTKKPGYSLKTAFSKFPKYYALISTYLYELNLQTIIDIGRKYISQSSYINSAVARFEESLRKLKVQIITLSDPTKNEGGHYLIKETLTLDPEDASQQMLIAQDGLLAIEQLKIARSYAGLRTDDKSVEEFEDKCRSILSNAQTTLRLIRLVNLGFNLQQSNIKQDIRKTIIKENIYGKR